MFTVDLDDDGAWITSNEDLLSFDYDALLQIVEHAFVSDVDYEWDDTSHIAWQRFELPDGGWRVMVADTSATDITLRTLAIHGILRLTAVHKSLRSLGIHNILTLTAVHDISRCLIIGSLLISLHKAAHISVRLCSRLTANVEP
jgi:hypothetical protein